MNGFSITGPGKDSSKVGIMVSNVDNVVVNGPGTITTSKLLFFSVVQMGSGWIPQY